jgi:hypothetical protein
LISKEEDERFFVTTRESNQKKKSRSDEESFLLFFFFFFFSRGEKAKECRSLDERGCFFARFFPLRVDHSLLDEDPPRARETEREREKVDPVGDEDDGFLCVSSTGCSPFSLENRRFCLSLIFWDIFEEKRQILHSFFLCSKQKANIFLFLAV